MTPQTVVSVMLGSFIAFIVFFVGLILWRWFSESSVGTIFIKKHGHLVAPFFVKLKNIQVLKGKNKTTNSDEYYIRKGWMYHRYHSYNTYNGWHKHRYPFPTFEKLCTVWDECILKMVNENDIEDAPKRIYIERIEE